MPLPVEAYTPEATRAEMQQRVKDVAAIAPEQGRKAALAYAARLLGLPAGRVKAIYYGEARRIDAHEADQIRAYYQAAQALIEARHDYETRRSNFLRDHPRLAWIYPPALGGGELSAEAAAAAASGLAKRHG